MSVDGVTGMRVPPHPHIGLQTVTWLMSGNVLAGPLRLPCLVIFRTG